MHEFLSVHLVAITTLIYNGEELSPGDPFIATPIDADYLRTRKRAKDAPSPSAPSPSAPSPSAPSPSAPSPSAPSPSEADATELPPAAPVEAPVAAPVEAPVAAPVEAPVEAPAAAAPSAPRKTFARKTISRLTGGAN